MPRAAPPDNSVPAANQNRLCPSVAFLQEYKFPYRYLSTANSAAIRNGTTAATELLTRGLISEDAYYRTWAGHHGLDYVDPELVGEALTRRDPSAAPALARRAAWCGVANRGVLPLQAPAPGSYHPEAFRFGGGHACASQTSITSPSALRSALIRRTRHDLAERASEELATNMPEHSAKFGAGAWHGFAIGGALVATLSGLLIAPGGTLLTVHAALSIFFLSCVLLRVVAALAYRPRAVCELRKIPNHRRPVYSVIVALHEEAPVVPDLVQSLKSLRWPASKLEIKLVCEDGDAATAKALVAQRLDRRFEVITTPLTGPQTKPKALNFAMPFCTGEFITLFDAEDRPHPDQLEEAWQIFRESDAALGALQAPLVIANPRHNLLTTMFHLEFAALFRGILQWLADRDLPIPLGGTSTHFRREAIERVGGWDAYNVTEDADLGFRLWRSGYRIGVLTRPTYEDAPETVAVWLRQRTRWIKGWLQTWIVRTRRATLRCRGQRLSANLVMHTLLAGTVVSALFYPFTIVTVAAVALISAANEGIRPAYGYLAMLDLGNIVLSFGAFTALSFRTLDRRLRGVALKRLPALPLYWLLGSLAGWRAVRQYFSEPFLWEKTPHKAHDPDGDFHHMC